LLKFQGSISAGRFGRCSEARWNWHSYKPRERKEGGRLIKLFCHGGNSWHILCKLRYLQEEWL